VKNKRDERVACRALKHGGGHPGKPVLRRSCRKIRHSKLTPFSGRTAWLSRLKKPDIGILSPQFLAEVRGLKHKNVAAELLGKLLKDKDGKCRMTNSKC